MFRCPSCAQAHEIRVVLKNGEPYAVRQNKEMTEVIFHNGMIEIDKDHALHESTEKRIKEETDMEQLVECPECQEVNTLANYIEAKVDTLKYHEMNDDQLCHCGGELWMDQIPGTPKFGFVCDKCSWVKPKKVVNGG